MTTAVPEPVIERYDADGMRRLRIELLAVYAEVYDAMTLDAGTLGSDSRLIYEPFSGRYAACESVTSGLPIEVEQTPRK